MLLSNEGSLTLLSRPARLLAGWAHDTTAVVHGEVQARGARGKTAPLKSKGAAPAGG
jgi:hypothetical protein